MKNGSLKRVVLATILALALAASFIAGKAFAADSRLDLAIDNVVKAIALLEAASDPNHPHRPFGRHRDKAVTLLKRAIDQVEKAKDSADKPPK
jgi:hypothetical protein